MTLEIKYRPALKSDLKFLLDLRMQTMNPHLIASFLKPEFIVELQEKLNCDLAVVRSHI